MTMELSPDAVIFVVALFGARFAGSYEDWARFSVHVPIQASPVCASERGTVRKYPVEANTMTNSSRRMSHLLARTLYLSLLLAPVLMSGACGGGATPATQSSPERAEAAPAAGAASHDIDQGAIDPSVAPGDDFFRYANGGWLKRTEIPPDRSSYGVWSILFDRAQQRTRELMERAAAGSPPAGSDEHKVA